MPDIFTSICMLLSTCTVSRFFRLDFETDSSGRELHEFVSDSEGGWGPIEYETETDSDEDSDDQDMS